MARGKIVGNSNTTKPPETDLIKTTRNKNVKFDYKFIKMASRLMASGVKQQDLAFVMGVCPRTITRWKEKYPVFRKALEDGKEMAVSNLINEGLRAATGREIHETTEEYELVEGEWTKVKEKVVKKQREPNATLLMFFLCNLAPEHFKRKMEVDSRSTKVSLNGDDVRDGIERLVGRLADDDNIMDAEFEDTPDNEG